MDELVKSDDDCKVTVLIDARWQEGCQNVPAHSMMPFFQMAASVFPNNFPERLDKVVIYPVPLVVSPLWWGVQSFLDTVTRDKVILLYGEGTFECGVPLPDGLGEYVEMDQLPPDGRDDQTTTA